MNNHFFQEVTYIDQKPAAGWKGVKNEIHHCNHHSKNTAQVFWVKYGNTTPDDLLYLHQQEHPKVMKKRKSEIANSPPNDHPKSNQHHRAYAISSWKLKLNATASRKFKVKTPGLLSRLDEIFCLQPYPSNEYEG
jgi:hypothetical protein